MPYWVSFIVVAPNTDPNAHLGKMSRRITKEQQENIVSTIVC